MNRKITFYTDKSGSDVCVDYQTTKEWIEHTSYNITTTQLVFLSFDLLDKGFTKILLEHKENIYELKLGKNTWTNKELRKEHNLLKLVTSYILNNE